MHSWSTTMESRNGLSIASGVINDIGATIERLHAMTPLASVEVKETSALNYEYTWKTADGRVWKQDIVYANADDIDPSMTFDVPDLFKLSEFKPHRVLRDILIPVLVKFQIVKCKVTLQAEV